MRQAIRQFADPRQFGAHPRLTLHARGAIIYFHGSVAQRQSRGLISPWSVVQIHSLPLWNVYPLHFQGLRRSSQYIHRQLNRSKIGINYGTGERLVTIFNPLYPPVLGDFVSWGIPPNPQQRGSAPLHSLVDLNTFECLPAKLFWTS